MRCTTPEEFSYFTINTPNKWREGRADSVTVDREGRLTLAPTANVDPSGKLGRATGLAVGDGGDLFIIDAEDCQIHRLDAETGELRRLECVEGCGAEGCEHAARRRDCCDGGVARPWRVRGLFGCGVERGRFGFESGGEFSGGLAFGRGVLYVADTFNHRVQCFYLPHFQVRFVLGKEGCCGHVSGGGRGEFDRPKDVVTDRRGNLYVLDYGNARVQKFDRLGRFLGVVGARGGHRPRSPESIAVDKEGSLYVLDSGTATVEKFGADGEWRGTAVRWPGDIPEQFRDPRRPARPSAVAVGEDGTVYVAEGGAGAGSHIHRFAQTLDPARRYLGRFGDYEGGCFKLVADAGGRLYGSCGPGGEVLLFGGGGRFGEKGTYYSKVFDSTIEECAWHRLALDVEPAEKSALELRFRASDEAFAVGEEDEQRLPWRHLFKTPHGAVGVEDALFPKEAVGRYLQLMFVFTGDGLHAHKVKEARLYSQRTSYLRYLPGTYQEDEDGRYFLERFLSIFESVNYGVEQEIAGVARYFDPAAVDAEFLDWLGTWLAALRDANWPEPKRREFLKRAFRLYQIRGTADGLRQMVELFSEGRSFVVEHHRLRAPMVLGAGATLGSSTVVGQSSPKRLVLEESSRIGEFSLIEADAPAPKPFEAGAYDFTIVADTSKLDGAAQVRALRRLIEEEKPAHTRYFLRTGGAALQLGVTALLEVDTRLSKGFETARLGLTSRLGTGTFVGKRFSRRGVIGARSTIMVDAVLH